MKGMKTRGFAEIESAQMRLYRLRAMKRVSPEDTEYIDDRLREVLARIVSMEELDEEGEPVG